MEETHVSNQDNPIPDRLQYTLARGIKVAGVFAAHFEAKLLLVHIVPVLPALPNASNYVMYIPEYERLLHKGASEKLDQLARRLMTH
jgi:hypothetical protein